MRCPLRDFTPSSLGATGAAVEPAVAMRRHAGPIVKTHLSSSDECAAAGTVSSTVSTGEIELKTVQGICPVPSEAAASEPTQAAGSEGAKCLTREQTLHVAHVGAYLVVWYAISITLTLYNKWLFAIYGLHFPLLITSLHIFLKVPACRFCMWLFSVPTVRFAGWRVILLEVMPSGIATAADIGLSNQSYLFISVTYYTIVKSSVPLWIMLFSACYGLLRIHASLVLVLLCICSGIILTTLKEVVGADDLDLGNNLTTANATDDWAANATLPALATSAARQLRRQLASATEDNDHALLGGLLVLGASLSAGFRWACTQLLLTARPPPPSEFNAPPSVARGRSKPYWTGLSPLTLLYYSSPFGCVALLPLAVAVEWQGLQQYLSELSASDFLLVVLLACIGAILAFFLLLAELRVVQLSSGLTLSVAGIFKEVLTVGASALLLGDHLTPYNVGGLLLCLVGIGLYNRLQLQKMHAQAKEAARGAAVDSASLFHVNDNRIAQQVDR